MSFQKRGHSSLSTSRLAARVTVFALSLLALAVGYATGFPLGALGVVVLVSVALEWAASSLVTRGVLRSVDDADAPAAVQSVVAEVSASLDIPVPDAVHDPDGEAGVSVLDHRGRTVLLVSGPLAADLDPVALRGVVAHELGHVAKGHLRRLPLREATGHVVGVVALWILVLQGLNAGQAVVLGGVYLVAAVARHNELYAIAYVAGSLGTVLVPMALDAYTSRLEECEADDVAVAETNATDYCTALYRITAGDGQAGGVGGRPGDARRGLFDRLTAVYPTTEDRLARQGLDLAEVAARVDGNDGGGAGAVSTD